MSYISHACVVRLLAALCPFQHYTLWSGYLSERFAKTGSAVLQLQTSKMFRIRTVSLVLRPWCMYCALSACRPVLVKAAFGCLKCYILCICKNYFMCQCPRLYGPCFLEFLVALSNLQAATALGVNSRGICRRTCLVLSAKSISAPIRL